MKPRYWVCHAPINQAPDYEGAARYWLRSVPPGWHECGPGLEFSPMVDMMLDGIQVAWRVIGLVMCNDEQTEAEVDLLESWLTP